MGLGKKALSASTGIAKYTVGLPYVIPTMLMDKQKKFNRRIVGITGMSVIYGSMAFGGLESKDKNSERIDSPNSITQAQTEEVVTSLAPNDNLQHLPIYTKIIQPTLNEYQRLSGQPNTIQIQYIQKELENTLQEVENYEQMSPGERVKIHTKFRTLETQIISLSN